MKDIRKIVERIQKPLCTLILTSASSSLLAQNSNLGKEVLSEATSSLTDLTDDVVKLLQVVMGMGALVCLAIVIFKVFKGDREAAEKLAWWLAGLTIGFVLLTVVARLIRA